MPALADQGRELDYLLAPGIDVSIGSVVRVPLLGRRVAGWVVGIDVHPPAGVRLLAVAKVTGLGPPPDVVDLSAWGAWRWAGRRTALLRSASPPTAVLSLPPPGAGARTAAAGTDPEMEQMARLAVAAGEAVVRLPPAADVVALLTAILTRGPGLVVTPAVEGAVALGRHLGRLGVPHAVIPAGWARAAAGGVTVVGARHAVWAPAPGASAVVVLDAHDGALVEQRAPSWSAWVVAAERARRAGVPCILVSPCPLLEQLRWGRLLVPARTSERRGWAAIQVLDRRAQDPRAGLLGEGLAPVLRSASDARRVICVLNRKGRVRLLACRACRRLTVCEHCAGPAQLLDEPACLQCLRCHRSRPAVCQGCGSGALRALRIGVSRLRQDLEALARLPVGEVTAAVSHLPDTPVLVGTEAVLNRAAGAVADGRLTVGAVVFVDFDAELLAPRYRAGEDALALLARATRLVGGRAAYSGGQGTPGRVLVQTRLPDHPALQSALRADPGRLAEVELAVRTELGLPPLVALAEVSGEAAVTAALVADVAGRGGVEVLGPTDGRWILRAPDHKTLCDALAAAGRPPGAGNDVLRIDVDPERV